MPHESTPDPNPSIKRGLFLLLAVLVPVFIIGELIHFLNAGWWNW